MVASTLTKVWLIIPAAGIGQRMQSEIPKQYIKIYNKTIIEHTLDCFLEHDNIVGIIVVLASHDKHWDSLVVNNPQNKPLASVQGGSNRSESVQQGLNYLSEIQQVSEDSWVMVHDAARPCLSKSDLDSLLELCDCDCVGGLLASPVRDTMKRSVVKNASLKALSDTAITVTHTEPRENLWHAQTPQMFRLGAIKSAINQCQSSDFEMTDECSAMEFVGEAPVIIESIHNNIKVTTPSDIKLAEFLLDKDRLEVIKYD